MFENPLILALVIGAVVALLAVAVFILTRKGSNESQAEPLVRRNPNYGPRSETDKDVAVAKEKAPKEKKAEPEVSSPQKAQPVQAQAGVKPAAEKPAEVKPVEAKPAEVQKPEPVAKKEPIAEKKPVVPEEDDWGDEDSWDIETSVGDIDAVGATSLEDDFSAGVKAQQEEAAAKPKKMVDRRSSEDDEDDWGDIAESQEDFNDGWAGPTLTRVSPETKQAFKEAALNQEFHVSKRKEADDFIVKCVQAYLKGNTDPAVKAASERIFALHSKIQLSDLPEIVESFVDSGDESNQKYFADFEDMCNTHEDSVLVLFEKFNTTLPINLRSRRIAEISDPLPAVVYLAPEWEDDDFDRPDFDERDEDVDESVDYLEDFYDQLEDDDEEEAGKKQA